MPWPKGMAAASVLLCQTMRLLHVISKKLTLPPALQTNRLPLGSSWSPANQRMPSYGTSAASSAQTGLPAASNSCMFRCPQTRVLPLGRRMAE